MTVERAARVLWEDDREARSAAWEAWKAQSGAEEAESFQAGWLAARPSAPTVTAEQVRSIASESGRAEGVVRDWLRTAGIEVSPGVRVTRVMSDERDAEFDRWLARVRAEARRDALNEAADAIEQVASDASYAYPEEVTDTYLDAARRLRARAAETPDGGA